MDRDRVAMIMVATMAAARIMGTTTMAMTIMGTITTIIE